MWRKGFSGSNSTSGAGELWQLWGCACLACEHVCANVKKTKLAVTRPTHMHIGQQPLGLLLLNHNHIWVLTDQIHRTWRERPVPRWRAQVFWTKTLTRGERTQADLPFYACWHLPSTWTPYIHYGINYMMLNVRVWPPCMGGQHQRPTPTLGQ